MPVTPKTLRAATGSTPSGTTWAPSAPSPTSAWSCQPSIPNTVAPTGWRSLAEATTRPRAPLRTTAPTSMGGR